MINMEITKDSLLYAKFLTVDAKWINYKIIY